MAVWLEAESETVFVDGEPVSLTPREYALFVYLASRPGEIVAREDLESEVWKFASGVRSHAVRMTALRLRKKLGEQYLETLPRRGIRLTPNAGRAKDLESPRAPLHEVVGRDSLMERVRTRLEEGERLITLHGPGGVGKTCLALAVMNTLPGPVLFCDLSAAHSLEAAVAELSTQVGLQLQGEGDALMSLTQAISTRPPSIYVLDNLEQLDCHAATLLNALLSTAHQFLVTSQTLISVQGEKVVEVPPLDLRDAERLLEVRTRDLGLATESDSATELVQLLDGLPLAIELAAARRSVFSVKELTQRLKNRFSLLKRPGETGRRSTLAECIQWSMDLLPPEELEVLAQVSVFAADFSIVDLEAVASADEQWVVDLFHRLLDRSLVQRLPSGRFQLLMSVREAVQSSWQSKPLVAAATLRHCEWFAQHSTIENCTTERLHACKNIPSDAPSELVGSLAVRTWRAIRHQTHVGEFRAVLPSMLERKLTPKDHETVLTALTWCLAVEGGFDTAWMKQVETTVAANRACDPEIRGELLTLIGQSYKEQGKFEASENALRNAIEITHSHPKVQAEAMRELAMVLSLSGAQTEAETIAARALDAFRTAGDRTGQVRTLLWQGRMALRAGREEEVEQVTAEISHAMFGNLDSNTQANVYVLEGQLALKQRAFERACEKLDQSRMLYRELGSSRYGILTGTLGEAVCGTGDPDRGLALLSEAVAAAEQSNIPILGMAFRTIRTLKAAGFNRATAQQAHAAMEELSAHQVGVHLKLELMLTYSELLVVWRDWGTLATLLAQVEKAVDNSNVGVSQAKITERIRTQWLVCQDHANAADVAEFLNAVEPRANTWDGHLLLAELEAERGNTALASEHRQFAQEKLPHRHHPDSIFWKRLAAPA